MDPRERNFLVAGIFLMVVTVTLFSFTYSPENEPANQVVLGVDVSSYTQIPVSEFKDKMDERGSVVIDVRSKEEFNGGHIEKAVNVDIGNNFKSTIANFPKNRVYFVYSKSNNRSNKALNVMNELGFSKVVSLEGGIDAWVSSSNPIENSL